jgi:hypothetical protein
MSGKMSERAYQRFVASYMLTEEELRPENRQEIIDYTEDVLQANRIECDERIEKMSEEELKQILEQVRKLRRNKKKKKVAEGTEQEKEEEEEVVVTP